MQDFSEFVSTLRIIKYLPYWRPYHVPMSCNRGNCGAQEKRNQGEILHPHHHFWHWHFGLPSRRHIFQQTTKCKLWIHVSLLSWNQRYDRTHNCLPSKLWEYICICIWVSSSCCWFSLNIVLKCLTMFFTVNLAMSELARKAHHEWNPDVFCPRINILFMDLTSGWPPR